MKILLVEDDLTLCNGLTHALQKEGFVVCAENHGKGAIAQLSTFLPDLVILDLGLPDMDGTEILKHLRSKQPALPVLILTARDALDDKVKALDKGADDYLVKPFEMPELLARLRVLSRRLTTASTSQISLNGVCMDLATHQVTVDKQPVDFSRREFMVLKTLMENPGRVQTREKLESNLYGWGEEVASNAIEVHISNLRKKLPDGYIRTLRGVGYTVNRD